MPATDCSRCGASDVVVILYDDHAGLERFVDCVAFCDPCRAEFETWCLGGSDAGE